MDMVAVLAVEILKKLRIRPRRCVFSHDDSMLSLRMQPAVALLLSGDCACEMYSHL